MANIAAKLSLNVPAITALCKGDPGISLRNGSGIPSPAVGIDGDFYIDTSVYNIYGPKTAGIWGSPTQLSNVSDSPRWNSSYGTVSALSATWNSTRTAVFNTSGDWNSVYSTTRAYSGDWNSALTIAQAVSTTVFATSGSWISTNTSVYNNSANWSSVYSYVNATSGATVGNALTVLNSNSSNWSSVYTAVYNTSAQWNNGSSAYTALRPNSASWISTNTSVYNNSANWNSVYSSVNNLSGEMRSGLTMVNTFSSRWENSWTLLNTKSATYNDTNTTVYSYSASWGGPRTDAVYTSVYNTSASWNNVYDFWNTQWTSYSANVNSRLNGTEDAIGNIQKDYASLYVPINAGVLDLDLSLSKTFYTTASANITRVDISNPNTGTTQFNLLLRGNGTSYTFNWPTRVVWSSSITPVRTIQNGLTDVYTFISVNSGQKYYGALTVSAAP